MSPFEGESERRAESAIDGVTLQSRDWHRKRPRSLSARDALEALAFEAAFLHVVSVSMRDGSPLSEDDHARLVVSVGRINAIRDEAIR